MPLQRGLQGSAGGGPASACVPKVDLHLRAVLLVSLPGSRGMIGLSVHSAWRHTCHDPVRAGSRK